MEAILTTVAAVVLIVVALAILARGWPRSYTRGGFRNRPGGEPHERAAEAEERGDMPRETEDDGWRWGDDEGPRRSSSWGKGSGR